MIQQHSRRGFAFGISFTPSAGFARRGDDRFYPPCEDALEQFAAWRPVEPGQRQNRRSITRASVGFASVSGASV
jgi:hypothetical protein